MAKKKSTSKGRRDSLDKKMDAAVKAEVQEDRQKEENAYQKEMPETFYFIKFTLLFIIGWSIFSIGAIDIYGGDALEIFLGFALIALEIVIAMSIWYGVNRRRRWSLYLTSIYGVIVMVNHAVANNYVGLTIWLLILIGLFHDRHYLSK